ncbi:MAG: apolipoprotein N-acyltransferase [Acidimicrobiales bacterium]
MSDDPSAPAPAPEPSAPTGAVPDDAGRAPADDDGAASRVADDDGEAGARPPRNPGRALLTTAAALGSGLCLAASVPPWGWWPLAFVGIFGWDRLLAGQPWGRRFRRSWLVAAAWLFPSMLWMLDLTPPGYVLAGAVFAAFFGIAGIACPPGRARWVALPAAVVLTEVIRWNWPFGGVPLSTLAMSQASAPLAFTVRTVGSLGLVGIVVIVGVGLSAAWERRWRAVGIAAAVVVVIGAVSFVAPRGEDTGPPLRVAVVQGGGPQRTRASSSDAKAVFERHLQASRQIHEPVDLVVWPENVISVEGRLQDNPEHAQLQQLARDLDATLLVGATEGISRTAFLNAQIVYAPDGTMGARYDKVRIVPFGEYVPFRPLIEKIAGDSGIPSRDAVPGEAPAVVPTPVGPIGVVISWEVFFSSRARDAIGNGGEVLTNPTNGSSYWLTQVQSQQVASSKLRALETGRWMLQAAPTGFSAIVDPDGRLVDCRMTHRDVVPTPTAWTTDDQTCRSGVSEAAVLERTISRRTGDTWSTILGPWPIMLASVLALAGAWAWTLRRRSPAP